MELVKCRDLDQLNEVIDGLYEHIGGGALIPFEQLRTGLGSLPLTPPVIMTPIHWMKFVRDPGLHLEDKKNTNRTEDTGFGKNVSTEKSQVGSTYDAETHLTTGVLDLDGFRRFVLSGMSRMRMWHLNLSMTQQQDDWTPLQIWSFMIALKARMLTSCQRLNEQEGLVIAHAQQAMDTRQGDAREVSQATLHQFQSAMQILDGLNDRLAKMESETNNANKTQLKLLNKVKNSDEWPAEADTHLQFCQSWGFKPCTSGKSIKTRDKDSEEPASQPFSHTVCAVGEIQDARIQDTADRLQSNRSSHSNQSVTISLLPEEIFPRKKKGSGGDNSQKQGAGKGKEQSKVDRTKEEKSVGAGSNKDKSRKQGPEQAGNAVTVTVAPGIGGIFYLLPLYSVASQQWCMNRTSITLSPWLVSH